MPSKQPDSPIRHLTGCESCLDMGYDASGQPCVCTYKPRKETPADQYPGIFRAIFRRPLKSNR